MSGSQIYVRLDSMSNAVTSKGIGLKDFQNAITTFPQHILLLNNQATQGEIETNTGLRMIKGEETIRQFFTEQANSSQLKWIDFKNIDLIRQMKPIEIAELLYFGHMKSQLHSPFFYKLQNNFVYFAEDNDFGKVYYRHMSDFYTVLQHTIERTLQGQMDDSRRFFQKRTVVKTMASDLLEELTPILQEGVVFDFSKADKTNDWEINAYIVEDKFRMLNAKDQVVLTLNYETESSEWSLEKKIEMTNFFGIS
ncbi:hypothetical protein [Vagococcus xieshaowenii]|uniref:Uncharacterized protein n=1 Tax=Vagococcus xieshaowenii TaxID=2562451 RepID=A0AAJ5JQ49_9ENTE|nr:hypothetical protein [Vagococcus xieshaowenii]QCA28945.1 hypothetical protein E4Z98_06305 [Vagococcus xieshaowenii]TFZ39243.1 hypothetical protein E4031_09560 [Vagococcus xieshaowenii]